MQDKSDMGSEHPIVWADYVISVIFDAIDRIHDLIL
jgi:hypothetical protein